MAKGGCACFWKKRFDRVIDAIRPQGPIPLRLELWNGHTFDLSSDPKVTIGIPRAASRAEKGIGVGELILFDAADDGSDLIVMGAHGHSPRWQARRARAPRWPHGRFAPRGW